ncbi:MAG: PAS domain-containing sensor histidine kinase [Proteobacteria bacterium]|nr:PAS domain-containing sensor histidine kinase [Pseudomonadota bacterium]
MKGESADNNSAAQSSDAETLAFLSAIIENLPNMVFLKDARDLNFVLLNRAAEDLIGLSREKLLGRNDYDFFPAAEADFFTQKDRAVLASGALLDIPEESLHTVSGVRLLHTKKVPINGPDGTPRYLLGISEDITERRAVEAAVERAREEAEAASRAKSSFLAKMSHEIRTPMNAVIGFSDLLGETPLGEEQRQYLNAVKTSAQVLLGLIDDMLDISRIESGKLALERNPFSIREAVNAMVEALHATAKGPLREVRKRIAADVPDIVEGDVRRFRQVLTNLVGNAVKFAQQGPIEVCIERQPCVEQPDLVVLHGSVADRGPGIAPDLLARVFEPFVQGDESSTRRQGGVGLGLSIASRIAEMMGGRMWAESPAPEGTPEAPGAVFHFILRLQLPARADAPAPHAPVGEGSPTQAPAAASKPPRYSARGARALLIEDNPINQLLARRLLEQLQFEVEVASDGGEGLAALTTRDFDVVLLDVLMPVLDGFAVAREIRRREQEGGRHVPILALTARAMKGDLERCLEAGMDGYVSKPFRSEDLLAALCRLIPDVLVLVDHDA